MNQLYALIALITALGLAFWRYDYVNDDRERLKAELSSANGIIATERENAQDAANRALARIIDESKRHEELQKLRDCVTAGTCGVRWKSCPKLPNTTNSGSGIAEAATEPNRELERWYFSHRELIDKYEVRLKALQNELVARSAKDYCSPKP